MNNDNNDEYNDEYDDVLNALSVSNILSQIQPEKEIIKKEYD